MRIKLQQFLLDGLPLNYILIHPSTAEQNDISPGTLLKTEDGKTGFRLITSTSINTGMAGVSPEKLIETDLKEGQEIKLIASGEEGVTRIIRRKMKKRTLTETEIETFISALDYGILTNSHIAAFGTAIEINGMHEKEITAVAESIIRHSKIMTHKGKEMVVDKHSIGGIAGNRITPLMIPIISSAGFKIPKVSTRAITSPAGTVDALEVVCPMDLTFEEALDVVDQTGACMVNGETVGLGAVMDKFLSVVKQIKVDPKEMMIASILAKKKAAGSQFVMIDLPTGRGSKLPLREDARRLAYDFSSIGNKLGLKVECIISPGDKPIGNMIGPALEMTEVLRILQGERGSLSLVRKALSMSGLILEGCGAANRGEGYEIASQILSSGKAFNKFKEIIEAQGGDPSVSWDSIPVAPYSHIIKAERSDIVYTLDSENIGIMARAAGAPHDKMAGVILHVDRGDEIKKGDPIIEIRAHSEGKLSDAIAIMQTTPPITLERSVLEHITGMQS